jgi:hypothetical protein
MQFLYFPEFLVLMIMGIITLLMLYDAYMGRLGETRSFDKVILSGFLLVALMGIWDILVWFIYRLYGYTFVSDGWNFLVTLERIVK